MHHDTLRALTAARTIADGRSSNDHAAIMVTLEHAVALVLISLYEDPRKAALMMTEALAPGVEARIAHYAAKKGEPYAQ